MNRFWTFTETGGHQENEDAFCVGAHPAAPGMVLCFVADGQGGRAGGGPAARLACQEAMRVATQIPPGDLLKPFTWPEFLSDVDKTVHQDQESGFTTLVGLCASEGWIAGASSGDSAAILIQEGKVLDLTRNQHKNPPVGSGCADIAPFSAKTKSPWSLVLMTDGVWKYVGWDGLKTTALRERGEALIEALQQQARLPGNGQFQDDFTVVVLEE